jgi:hypothetical protein
MSPLEKICLLAISVSANVASLLVSFRYYRRYYVRMKTHHRSEWLELMNRDEVVAGFGEWIRWPFGSIYLIESYLRRNVDFDDRELRAFKKRGLVACYVFACSFLVFVILMGFVLPN